jgi:hypothetical protein
VEPKKEVSCPPHSVQVAIERGKSLKVRSRQSSNIRQVKAQSPDSCRCGLLLDQHASAQSPSPVSSRGAEAGERAGRCCVPENRVSWHCVKQQLSDNPVMPTLNQGDRGQACFFCMNGACCEVVNLDTCQTHAMRCDLGL